MVHLCRHAKLGRRPVNLSCASLAFVYSIYRAYTQHRRTSTCDRLAPLLQQFLATGHRLILAAYVLFKEGLILLISDVFEHVVEFWHAQHYVVYLVVLARGLGRLTKERQELSTLISIVLNT